MNKTLDEIIYKYEISLDNIPIPISSEELRRLGEKSKTVCKENKPRIELLAINHFRFRDRDKIEYFKSNFNSIDKSNFITLYNNGVLIPLYNKAIVYLEDIYKCWNSLPLSVATLLLSDMIGNTNIYDYLADTRSKTWLKDYENYLNQFEIVIIKKPRLKYLEIKYSNSIFMIRGRIEKICDNDGSVYIRRSDNNKLSKFKVSDYYKYCVLFSKNHLELFLQNQKDQLGAKINKLIDRKKDSIDNYKQLIQNAEEKIDKYYEKYLVETGKLDYLFRNIF